MPNAAASHVPAADNRLVGHKYPSQQLSLLSFPYSHTTAMNQFSPTNEIQQHHHQQQRAYVNALVVVTVQAIASIWPASTNKPANKPIADLNTFLHHILKHSRTTHSTLQLAIFYLFRIRPKVHDASQEDVYIKCGRRMFLAALICAHKFLQDKTYKNSAWSKVSGLSASEINHAEKVMLQLLDYRLYVKKDTYDQWIGMLQNHLKLKTIPAPPSPPLPPLCRSFGTTSDDDDDRESDLQSDSTPSDCYNIQKLGMPTPVEIKVACIPPYPLSSEPSCFGLPSPPELERKRKVSDSDDFGPVAVRRRF
ncbi:hypothetical protein DFQ28_005440 [Apophysomyces sp. BC1034]|nr:hypothetical protein DFQ30_010792 [Apophysomyces sp. BC1015]KAG0181089.1 hypothetical protein DFQ29_009404 [Apophysomyces sp. BC1021]KAG0188076.1 hypothetical protein DFQ28_005440 [Apophysomyces sp. BC1034]